MNAPDKAQRAFLDTAKAASDLTTARLLNRAINHRNCLWQNENLTEDEFNARMVAFCLELTNGDMLKAQLLASAALK